MKKQENKLTICPTKRPHTFFLKYNLYSPTESYAKEREKYKKEAQRFVQEVNDMGLKANLLTRYKWNSNYYITFRSKYDVVAFKLKWVL